MSLELQNIRQHKIAHILQFSIPSIIGMLLTSLVAINDGFFTGNYVGPDGLAAINLGLPILFFLSGYRSCIRSRREYNCRARAWCKRYDKSKQCFYAKYCIFDCINRIIFRYCLTVVQSDSFYFKSSGKCVCFV